MFTQINDTELKATNGGAYLGPDGSVVVTAPEGMLGNAAPRGAGETREITLRDGTTKEVGVNTVMRDMAADGRLPVGGWRVPFGGRRPRPDF